jgi:hypothetical protein
MDLYVHGCLYAGDGVHIVTDQNPIDYSDNTLTTWTNITITDAQSDNASGIFFGLYTTDNDGTSGDEFKHAIRKTGHTQDYYSYSDVSVDRNGWVACDGNQKIQQQIENVNRDLYIWGWTYPVSSADSIYPEVTLVSPANNTQNTTDSTPDFTFNVTDETATTLSCELFLNNTGYGIDESVANGTDTTITANASLANGDYNWYVNCSDGTNTNISEKRVITINVTVGDTCNPTSPLTGNYLFNCSDNCTQSSALNAGGYNITFSDDDGHFNWNANISNFDKIFKYVNCELRISLWEILL